jgi:hypothetical protein
MRMVWSDLLFAHWAVDPSKIERLLPAGLELDTHDGNAWIGIVPFLMSDVAPRGFPAVPGLSRFPELNVRTYVTCNGKPGVWFFSLDASNKIAVRVARATFHLPYMDARMSIDHQETSGVHYRSLRIHRKEPPAEFQATYQPSGEPFHATPGTLEYWLTARYCLYSVNRNGSLFRGEINHPPWMLRRADCQLDINRMGNGLQLDFSEPPHLLYADPVRVQAWWPTRCPTQPNS